MSQPDYARMPSTEVEMKPGPSELWQRYHSAGQGSALEETLVKKYIPLVKSVAGRLAVSLPPHVGSEDLHSAGMVGLLSAIRQFNPSMGRSFEPYAWTRIRGAIIDELRRMDWVPRSVHAKARRVQTALAELESKLLRLPTDEEMAAALQMSLGDYHELLDLIRPASFIWLDAEVISEDADELSEHELLEDLSQEDASEAVSRADLARLIAERIESLPELHRKVLAMIYYEDFRLREISEICGLCESRICQIHTQAILAIRAHVEACEARPRKPSSPLAA